MNLLEVRPKKNYCLYVRYDDGVSGEIDLARFVGRGVFAAWEEAGIFEKVTLAEGGHPEWPGGLDLCPDYLYIELTGKRPEQVFPALNHISTHA